MIMILAPSALSLICMIHSVLSYPSGIQTEPLPRNSPIYDGCYRCITREYTWSTNSSDIEECVGPYLFVGAGVYSPQRRFSIILGAFGSVAKVQTVTARNSPNLFNGVYWYFTPGESFGFLNDTNLMQNKGDTGTSYPASRLSWILDSGVGGYRAGKKINPLYEERYFKIILDCPLPVDTSPSPSASPTFSTSSCPSASPSCKRTRRSKSKKPTKAPKTKAPKPSRRKRPSRAPSACDSFSPSSSPSACPV